MSQKFLTIHGHFYQPPRENPWTEVIDRQRSAAPFHDWNERINAECYTPNAYARILNASKRIDRIVNNYERISLNFGPTLLSWLEQFAPLTYQRILEADKKSMELFGGHGGAIAQAYNHAILPLCNKADQITQVRWGLADFRHRFNREPESIWLPETGVNDEALKTLIDHGMKYVILSPYQAKRARPLTGGDWHWVEHGEIDTRQAYRWFEKDSAGRKIKNRYIDVFFYHGELSRAVGFEKLASNAQNFADRISHSYSQNGTSQAQLVSIATDGETYGHHERFAEMGLAYLLNVEAPKRGIRVTNYGEFLSLNPPEQEVELKEGEQGEGTAWSCAHGLGRWRRNCGCRGDGPPEWTQDWRGPLRDALDQLRDELNQLTIEFGEQIFRDPAAARNDYIDVILKRNRETVDAFLAAHQKKNLSSGERLIAIKLMEMERNVQLMYTSCGWFFTELSGIETVQVIQYAARAIQLAEALSGRPFEDRFLQNLKQAPSNVSKYGDGKGIYKKLIKPAVVSFVRVVNTYATRSLFLGAPEKERLYHYTIEKDDVTTVNSSELTLMIGKVSAQSGVTWEKMPYTFVLVKSSSAESINCYVRKINTNWDYTKHRDNIIANFDNDEYNLLLYLEQNWGNRPFGLQNMFFEERQQVIQLMLKDQLNKLGENYTKIYKSNRDLITTLVELGAVIPEELRVPARYTLSRELHDQIRVLGDHFDRGAYTRCVEISRTAAKLNFKLDTAWPTTQLQLLIEEKFERLKIDPSYALCTEIQNLFEIAKRLKLNLQRDRIQNQIYELLLEKTGPLIKQVLEIPDDQDNETYNLLAAILQIAHEFGFDTKKYKDQIKQYETRFSENPRFWP